MPEILLPATKNFLKETFASYQETKNLWLEAGGKASVIIDTFDSRIRWGDLFQKLEAGAIDPIKLIISALKEYPLNKVLLLELQNQLSEDDLSIGRNFIFSPSSTTLAPLNSISQERASAAVTLGVIEDIEPNILQSSNDTSTHTFKQSFAQKAGEALAMAGGSAWLSIMHNMLNSL